MKSQKRKNFLKLAEKRVEKVSHTIRLIGNLSNTNNYEYTRAEAGQIIKALRIAVKKCKLEFKKQLAINPTVFKLK